MVIVNRSPRVSRTRGSAWLTAASCRSRTPARSLPGGDVDAQRVVSALPRAVHPAEAFDLGVDLGLLEDQRVAGGDRLELGEADHVLADVLDLPGGPPTPHDLADELRLAQHRLPHVGVEGAFGDVADDLDAGVLVLLPDDPAFPLGDVSGPPRAVQVVQRDRPVSARWCRRPCSSVVPMSTETFPARASANSCALSLSLLRLVHEPDLAGGQAAGGELAAQVLVGAERALAGGGAEARRTRSAARRAWTRGCRPGRGRRCPWCRRRWTRSGRRRCRSCRWLARACRSAGDRARRRGRRC